MPSSFTLGAPAEFKRAPVPGEQSEFCEFSRHEEFKALSRVSGAIGHAKAE
jgi:hypothetical protein